MPTYEYLCEECRKTFTLLISMSEHDKGEITCTSCKGSKVIQQYTPFFAKTSRKS
jgi:putative FmdB family regulatory protein